MDYRHVPPAPLGLPERVLRYPPGGALGDHLERDGGAGQLELVPLVEVLGVLPHYEHVDAVDEGADAGVDLGGAQVRVEVEHLPQAHYDVLRGLPDRALEGGVR
jgi:hypothetical protein